VVNDLKARYFDQAGRQIGVNETNDFIYGDLHKALRAQLLVELRANNVGGAIPIGNLPDHPAGADPTLTTDELAGLLGLKPGDVTGRTDADLREEMKLEAPLAVVGRPWRAGYFPLNKFSTLPLLIKAARAEQQSAGSDVRKRLMVVPYCHVSRLMVEQNGNEWRVTGVQTNLQADPIPVPPTGSVIAALGTIESTRLALESLEGKGVPQYNLIGKNLMAHLRSNLTIRVPRTSITGLGAAGKELQTSALFVKGRVDLGGGKKRYFHMQITATGLPQPGYGSEAELFQKVPDIDTIDAQSKADDQSVEITIRGIGEMDPVDLTNPAALHSRIDLTPGTDTDFGVRRAQVAIQTTPDDDAVWRAMDDTSNDVARAFAGGQPFFVQLPVGGEAAATAATNLETVLPYTPKSQGGRRDGLGTTHHEAGTLWMGDNPATSVTNSLGRFHAVENLYAAPPATVPTTGSPNPMLTGIALVRRLGDALVAPIAPDPGFTSLFDGTSASLAKWRMSTIQNQPGRDNPGSFLLANRTLEAHPGTDIGLFWHTDPTPVNFVLKLEWLRTAENDNSGVFVRFPNPGSKGYDNTAFVGVDFGFEIQIDQAAAPDGQAVHKTGAIYNFAGPTDPANLPVRPVGWWNQYEIRVQVQTYTVLLNGVQITQFTFAPGSDAAHPDRGLPIGDRFIGLQTHTGLVAFRNVQIKAI